MIHDHQILTGSTEILIGATLVYERRPCLILGDRLIFYSKQKMCQKDPSNEQSPIECTQSLMGFTQANHDPILLNH